MNWLRELRIGVRLAVAFCSLLVFIGLLAVMGVWGSRSLGEGTRSLYQDRAVPMQQLATINDLMQRNRVLVMDMLLQPGAANVEKLSAEFVSNQKAMDALWQRFTALPQTPQEADLIQKIQALRSTYMQEALAPASAAMQDNKYDDASDLYLTKISPMAPSVQAPMDQLMKLKIDLAAQEFEAAMVTRKTVNAVVLGGALLAIGLGVVLAWVACNVAGALFHHAVEHPLSRLGRSRR